MVLAFRETANIAVSKVNVPILYIFDNLKRECFKTEVNVTYNVNNVRINTVETL